MNQYLGEQVSQLEHALQTANLAVSNRASDAPVVASLLHDIGHLVEGQPDAGIDARQRLHVAAKRYLCAVDEQYERQLSPASIQSLALQGGPMNDAEAAQFAWRPHASEAVTLRLWDDEAKQPGSEVPPLDACLPYIRRLLRPAADTCRSA